MDDIVEDARREVQVMLLAWQNQGTRGGIFHPHVKDGVTSETSSEYFNPERISSQNPEHNLLRVVVGDLGHQIKRDAAERERQRYSRSSSTRDTRSERGSSTDNPNQMAAAEDTPLLGVLKRNDSGISPGTSVIGNSQLRNDTTNVHDRLDAGESSGPRISWSDNLPGPGKPAL